MNYCSLHHVPGPCQACIAAAVVIHPAAKRRLRHMATPSELVADIVATAGQLAAVACYATPEVERNLRLAVELLDAALCRLQVARHAHTRSLLDEPAV